MIFFKLFKINKNIQDTLSLRVARSGTKKPDTTYRCIRLLSAGGSPVSFMSFVNFSQFNLGFYKFRKRLNTILAMQNDCSVTKEIIIVTILSLRNNSLKKF